MIKLMLFLVVVFIGITINRSLAWIRRADARHRERFRAAGFVENFPALRLRLDQYKRIALMTWVFFAALPLPFMQTPAHYRFAFLRVVVAEIVFMVSAGFLAALVYVGVYMFKERTLPDGLFPAIMLSKQFHAPILTLKPDGSYGTAKMLTPAEIGLINLQGLQTRGFRPIMPEVQK